MKLCTEKEGPERWGLLSGLQHIHRPSAVLLCSECKQKISVNTRIVSSHGGGLLAAWALGEYCRAVVRLCFAEACGFWSSRVFSV